MSTTTIIANRVRATSRRDAADLTTILVIEDDPGFAGLLTEVFSREPDLWLVGIAASVSAGLDWVRRRPPSVVLTDYHLGDGTGDRAVGLIREVAPSTAIVIMSCDSSGEARAAAVRVGADAFLDKAALPIRRFPEALRAVARRV